MKKYFYSLDGIKANIPKFYDSLKSEEFLDWLSVFEKLFDYKEILEGIKVKLVAKKLHGHAFVWWDKVQEMFLHIQKSKITNWKKMKSRLKKKILPNYKFHLKYLFLI